MAQAKTKAPVETKEAVKEFAEAIKAHDIVQFRSTLTSEDDFVTVKITVNGYLNDGYELKEAILLNYDINSGESRMLYILVK